MHELKRTGATAIIFLLATLALPTPAFAQIDLTGEWAGDGRTCSISPAIR